MLVVLGNGPSYGHKIPFLKADEKSVDDFSETVDL